MHGHGCICAIMHISISSYNIPGIHPLNLHFGIMYIIPCLCFSLYLIPGGSHHNKKNIFSHICVSVLFRMLCNMILCIWSFLTYPIRCYIIITTESTPFCIFPFQFLPTVYTVGYFHTLAHFFSSLYLCGFSNHIHGHEKPYIFFLSQNMSL